MTKGAHSPEELETLMEDALLLRDGRALAQLFEVRGLFVSDYGQSQARGHDEIAQSIYSTPHLAEGYTAEPRNIFHARDLALLVGDDVINVVRRGRDRLWKVVISVRYTGNQSSSSRAVQRETDSKSRESASTLVHNTISGLEET
jgi:hypothetical protein